MLTDRMPPYDEASEQAVIGSILIDESSLQDVCLQPEDFFMDQTKACFQAILNIREGINLVTAAHELERMGKLEEIGGAAYLSRLAAETPTSAHAEYYAKIVKDCATNRRLISSAHKIMKSAYANGDPQENISEAQKLIYQAALENKSTELFSAHELARSAVEYYGKLRISKPGILTGIRKFDEQIGGILCPEFIVLIANTSMGKTTLALQIARHIAVDYETLIISLEMSKQAVTNKHIAAFSGINSHLINLGNYPPEREERILNATVNLASLKLHYSNATTTLQIRHVIERLLYTTGLKFVMVDYLQKIRDKYGDSDTQRLGYISSQLFNMTQDYQIPILALSQLHRGQIERQNKRPVMSDIRGSGNIEEDADTICALYRPSYFDREKTDDQTEFIVLKDRLRGKLCYFKMGFDKDREIYT